MSYNITKTLGGFDYLSNILLTDISTASASENSMIASLNTRLITDENSILSLQSRLTVDEVSISVNNINSLTTQINSMSSRLSTDESNNISSISSIGSRFSSDEQSIMSNISQINNLSMANMNSSSNIMSLNTRITSDETIITNNSSSILNNSNSIISLNSRITTDEQSIMSNISQINNLSMANMNTSSTIISLNTRIGSDEGTINNNTNSVMSLNNRIMTDETTITSITSTLTNMSYTTGTSINKFNLSSTNVTKIASPYYFINSNTSGYSGSDLMTWQMSQSLTAGATTSVLNIMYIPNNYSILISGTFTGNDATNVGNNSLWITFQNAGFSANASFPSGRYAKTVTPSIAAVNYTGTSLGTVTAPLTANSSQIVVTITASTTFGVSINGKWTFQATAFSTN